MDTTTLKPGTAAGELRLRSSPEVILGQLGEPEYKEISGDEEVWSFPGQHLTLIFEREGESQYLAAIHSRDVTATVANTAVVGRSKSELASLFHIRGFGHPSSDTDGIVEDLTFAEAGLVLSFYEGRVEEVSVVLPATLAGRSREHALAGESAPESRARRGCLTMGAAVALAIGALLTIA